MRCASTGNHFPIPVCPCTPEQQIQGEDTTPHGEGCLLSSVIHGGLFLSRKGCRVSLPQEMGKSLHLPIHSTQGT